MVEVPAPACRDQEVLVKTAFSLISSGTESWSIEATQPIAPMDLVGDRSKLKKALSLAKNVWSQEGMAGLLDYVKSVRSPQVPLGYSLSGVVMEVGKNVTDIVAGDKVACAGEGKACHAEFTSIPRNLITKIPPNVDLEDAAFTTVGSIALHGFRRSGAQVGDAIGVLGTGLVGNLTIQVAKAAGCRIVAVDVREDRLQLASQSGADLALTSADPMLSAHISNFTEGRGLDCVFVCAATSSSDPVNLASKIARDKGRVIVVGRVGMEFDRKEYYQKELEVVMSRSLGPGRYEPNYEEKGIDYPPGYVRWTLNRNMDAFLRLLREGRVNVRSLVASVYPIQEAATAYSRLESEAKVGVLLRYNPDLNFTKPSRSAVLEERKLSGKIDVALVGPGNYAKEILIPSLRNNTAFNLRSVISSSPIHARQIAERYHFERFGTDYLDVLKDDELDLVMITTPNNLHCPMVVQAAKAGKAIFVEKPLCIREEELNEILRVQNETGTRIIVGFNRRYAPLVLRLKEEMDRLDGPFLINYRVNADYIPPSRWVQDPEVGGGRVISECCHFFDLFNFLLDSRNPVVGVTCADINGSNTVARDNLVAVSKYADGSVATLTYSALGNRTMDRERLEIFGQKTALVLEDFKTLKILSEGQVKTYNSRGIDKGHSAELVELTKLMRGEPSSVISFDEAVAAMQTTFEAEKMARNSITSGEQN